MGVVLAPKLCLCISVFFLDGLGSTANVAAMSPSHLERVTSERGVHELKRVVLVLDINDDEAALIEAAISTTKVRFGGMTLSGLLEASRAGSPNRTDGAEVHYALSEGSAYLGSRPLRLDTLASELR
jgi:hypothetical protein